VVIECVINVSEGRDMQVLDQLSAAAGTVLLDRHADPDHHRSVFTLAGPADDVVDATRALASATVARLDLSGHIGVHPRLGVLDVVPFIPYAPRRQPPTDLSSVIPLRDAFAQWLAGSEGVPSFLYGPLSGGRTRTLPQVRMHAFADMSPDFGPVEPHPTAGATAVGARGVLVAYNLWVTSPEVAREVAPLARRPGVRVLGLEVGERAQVSCNLVDPTHVGPAQVYDAVATLAERSGGAVTGAELVGLIPHSVLQAVPEARWSELGLSAEGTVEARLER
jgi:glutamate formiminotransferase